MPNEEKKSDVAGIAFRGIPSGDTSIEVSSSGMPGGMRDCMSGITGVAVGSNIQSSRFNLLSVVVDGGRRGSEASVTALEVSLRLSAVGIFAAKSFTSIV